MSFLWDSVKQAAEKAGQAAITGGTMAKLKAEIALVEREITSRQEKFGVELYDYVEPLSRSQEFFAANDRMTEAIRGPMLTAQREIAALSIRRGKFKEQLSQAEVARKSAFPTAATTVGEKVLNAAKAARFAGNEAKIYTDVSVTETLMKSHKHKFGVKMYSVFVELEDKENWLPTVRDIRSLYDQTRRDIEKLLEKIAGKKKEFEALGGELTSYSAPKKEDKGEGESSSWSPEYSTQSASNTMPHVTPTLTQPAGSQYPASTMVPTSYSDQTSALSSMSKESNNPPPSSTSYNQPIPDTSFVQQTSTRGQELFAGIVPQTNTAILNSQEKSFQASTNSTTHPTMNNQNDLDPFSSNPPMRPTMNDQNGFDPFSSNSAFKTTTAGEYDPFSVFDNLSNQK